MEEEKGGTLQATLPRLSQPAPLLPTVILQELVGQKGRGKPRVCSLPSTDLLWRTSANDLLHCLQTPAHTRHGSLAGARGVENATKSPFVSKQ